MKRTARGWTKHPGDPYCDHYATQRVSGSTVANPKPMPGYIECLRCGATRRAL